MLHPKVINQLRLSAVKAIQEYSESVKIIGVDEDGNEKEDNMLPLVFMASEAFMVVAAWAATAEGMPLDKVEYLVTKLAADLPEYAMLAARKAANGEGPKSSMKDPLDVVDSIIKKAQSHDNS